MWFFFGQWFCFAVMLLGLAYFLYKLIRGCVWAWVTDDLYCRNCGYCLKGIGQCIADVRGRACSECGAAIHGPIDVRVGRREFPRAKKIWRGAVVLGLCLIWGIGVRNVPIVHRSLSWLQYDLSAELGKLIAEAKVNPEKAVESQIVEPLWEEVLRRHQAGEISAKNIKGLIDWCLAELSKMELAAAQGLDYTWRTKLRYQNLLRKLFDKGLMDQQQAGLYFQRMYSFDIDGRDRTRGDFTAYRITLDLSCYGGYSDAKKDLGMHIKTRLVGAWLDQRAIELDVYDAFKVINVAQKDDASSIAAVDLSQHLGRDYLKGKGVGEKLMEIEVEMTLYDAAGREHHRWRKRSGKSIDVVPPSEQVVEVVTDQSVGKLIASRMSNVKLVSYRYFDQQRWGWRMIYQGKGVPCDWAAQVFLRDKSGKEIFLGGYIFRGTAHWEGEEGLLDFSGYETSQYLWKERDSTSWANLKDPSYDVVFRSDYVGAMNSFDTTKVWVGEDIVVRDVLVDRRDHATEIGGGLVPVDEDLLEK